MSRPKLAIVVSHPIQHFCPQYSSWASISTLQIKVFFASRHGLDAYYDKNFGKTVQWQSLTLDFDHAFLPEAEDRPLGQKIDCPEIVTTLEEFNPDIVLVYGYIQPLQRRAMRWAKANNKHLLLIGDSELHQVRSKLKSIIKKLWLPRVFSSVDLFLTVGDANEAYYRNYGVPDHKFIRTFFPIYTALFDQSYSDREKKRAFIRKSIGIGDDQLMVLMAGKLVSWKRQIDLVATSNLLQATTDKITIVLAGSGPDSDKLQALAHKRGPGGVIFAGFVPPEDLVNYYIAADVYVHCSAKEPHSLAISEAIYVGLPVVVSDRCGSYGPSDDVRVGQNGFVYPCGDVHILAGILQQLSVSPEQLQQYSVQSRQIGVSHQTSAHSTAIVQAMRALRLQLCSQINK